MKADKKVLGLLGTGHAVTDINQGVLPMMLTYLQPVFAMSQFQVGVVMLAFNMSSSVIQPAFGILSDRVRAGWLIPAGCLFAGLGMGFTGLVPNYWLLLLAALISGLGIAAFHPEGSKFARFASGDHKASGMSLFSIGGNIGFALGPVVASFFFGIAGLWGSMTMWFVNGVMALLLWVNLSHIMSPGIQGAGIEKEGKESAYSSLTEELHSREVLVPFILLTIIVIMRSWVHFGMVTFLPQYYVHYLQQSESFAATLTTIFLAAGALGTLVGGPAADRWGLKNIITVSMAALIPLLYLFTIISGYLVTIVVAITGFTVISTFAITVVFAQELLPNNVGLASGVMLGFGIGVGGLGTTLLGWIADTWGLETIFYVMMFFPVIGLVLTLFLPRR